MLRRYHWAVTKKTPERSSLLHRKSTDRNTVKYVVRIRICTKGCEFENIFCSIDALIKKKKWKSVEKLFRQNASMECKGSGNINVCTFIYTRRPIEIPNWPKYFDLFRTYIQLYAHTLYNTTRAGLAQLILICRRTRSHTKRSLSFYVSCSTSSFKPNRMTKMYYVHSAWQCAYAKHVR